MAESLRVLSIQSHVVHGYCGNKSAVFPLQVLGFEVDFINSVQLSNHTGYPKFTGQVFDENDMKQLFDGLRSNELIRYDYLLTGYVKSPSILHQIVEIYNEAKKVNPRLIYVCDPVMGDNGNLYVPEALVPLYRDLLVPLADVITPNQFEAEQLTETKITNINDAWNAIEILHKKGCKTVVISSSELGDANNLIALASSKLSATQEKVLIKIPKIDAQFVGSGDIFAALLLAWLAKTDNNLKTAIEKTVASLQAVLQKTMKYAEGKVNSRKHMELKLIQSKGDLENPQVTVWAQNVQ